EELTVQAPLLLPGRAAVMVQVVVGGPDQHGRRPVSVYSRQADALAGQEWTCHGEGILTAGPATDPSETRWPDQWPPVNAVALDVEDLYPRLAEAGYGYGPAFQGLAGAW